MKPLLLNCDLGEWETAETARALITHVDLTNIACGGHAGSAGQLRACKTAADKAGARSGAHPGTPGNKGRLTTSIAVDDFTALLHDQLTFYQKHAGTPAHIKLHGSLYHLTEQEPGLRDAYLAFCENRALPLVALAGGHVVREAGERGLPALGEAFLDRRLRADGSLVPRTEHDALITDPAEVVARLPNLRGETLCIHSDSPHALEILRAVKAQGGQQA